LRVPLSLYLSESQHQLSKNLFLKGSEALGQDQSLTSVIFVIHHLHACILILQVLEAKRQVESSELLPLQLAMVF